MRSLKQKSLSVLLALALSSGIAVAAEPVAATVDNFEQEAWVSAKDINTIEAYEFYLTDFPAGRHAKYAKAAINKITKEDQVEVEPAENAVHKVGDAATVSRPAELGKLQPAPTPESPAVAATPTDYQASSHSQSPANEAQKLVPIAIR